MNQKQSQEGFQLLDALDIMNNAPEQPPSLVEGLLLEVGVSMLVGKPKSGKSSLARQLCVCIAEGRPFLGYEVQQGDAIYINLEGPADVFGAHLRKLGYTGQSGKIHLVHQRMPNNGDAALEMLTNTLSRTRVKLVVVDPVIKFLRLPDSDKNDLVSAAIEKLESAVRELNTHLLMLAHAKKRATEDVGDSTLGSTGFRGGTDTNLFLAKSGNGDRIISTEQRWGRAVEPTVVVFNEERGEMSLGRRLDEIEESRQEARKVGTRKRIENDIFNVVLKLKSASREQILERVKGKATTVLDILRQMSDSKQLQKQGTGTKNDPVLYVVAPVPVAEPTPVPNWADQIAPQRVI